MPDSPAQHVPEAIPAPLSPLSVETALPAEPLTRRMRRVSLWLILLLVASFTFLDYWSYSTDYHLYPGKYDLLIQGRAPAPAQYRVGVAFAAQGLRRLTHLGFRHLFAMFDFLFALASAFLLRAVLAGSRAFRSAAPASRWQRLIIFLLLFSFYLGWTTWYQRPETLACALFVAASLYLLCIPRSTPLMVAGLVVLSVLQGFVRADVAILFHFGLFLYVLVRGSRDFFAARGTLLLTSFLACLLPTAILYILIHRIFPHATYGDTAVFQLLLNIRPAMLAPFVLFMVPVAYTYRRGLARFAALEGPQSALLLIGFFYLASWAFVGRLEEVRIFVPFAMGFMPLTANLASDDIALPEL